MTVFQKSLVTFLLVSASGLVLAEACTYREAIMAMEQGNSIRGMALMRMANRDGDERASHYLAVKGYQIEDTEKAVSDLLQQPLLSLNRVSP